MGWITRRILLCLTLGLALTIASAWLPGALIRIGRSTATSGGYPPGFGFGPRPTTMDRVSTPGMDFIEIFVGYRSDRERLVLDVPTGNEPKFDGVLTPWMRTTGLPALHALVARDEAAVWRICFETRGWPARAAWCEYRYEYLFQTGGGTSGGPLSLRGAIVIPGTRSAPGPGRVPRTLPCRPIWSGLAINLGFWSVVAAPLVFAPALVRGGYRRWTGACTACGYDLTGAPGPACPECGRTAPV